MDSRENMTEAGGAAPVAIVIVSWNSREYLEGCLRSLGELSRPPAEIVVADNGSTDDSVGMVAREYPGVKLLENHVNLGFCRANNLAIVATTSPFVLVLNPDTRLAPRFLEELLPVFDDPSVGMAAGKMLRFDGVTIDSAGQELARSRQPLDRGYGRKDRGQYDRDGEVFGVCGAAALYRRAMLEKIADPGEQYFDERFFAFYEDLDLAWRARNSGWRAMYRHRAVGFHARGGSARGAAMLRRVAAQLGRDREVRYHIVKNRYLTILRNDSLRSYLVNLPFIAGRDLATLALLLFSAPGVLLRLWRTRVIFSDALARRRLDTGTDGDQLQDGG